MGVGAAVDTSFTQQATRGCRGLGGGRATLAGTEDRGVSNVAHTLAFHACRLRHTASARPLLSTSLHFSLSSFATPPHPVNVSRPKGSVAPRLPSRRTRVLQAAAGAGARGPAGGPVPGGLPGGAGRQVRWGR